MRDLSAASDAELVVAHNAGNRRAFGLLYQRHRLWVYRRVLSIVRLPDDAADIDQEVWTTLARQLPGYSPDAQLRTYLNFIIRSRVTEHFRRRARRPQIADTAAGDEGDDPMSRVADEAPLPDRVAESAECLALFEAALKALPVNEANVFLLKEGTDLSWQEIADTLAIPLETARARHRRGVHRLREALEPCMNTP